MTADPGSVPDPDILHASTVAFAGRAALIMGASGSGKSGLALQLMSLGAGLVADDRTALHRKDARVIADVPDAIRGKIEARGIGLLAVAPAGPTPIALVIDMNIPETERLPPFRTIELMEITLPLQRKLNTPYFPAAIIAYLEQGRIA